MYINSVYFTHHNLLSQICFSPQSLWLCQSHWDPGWTIDFSVKSIYGMIGPSKLLRSLEDRFWALLLLFTELEVLHPLDFGTVHIFASRFPLHCRKQDEEEPSGCFSFKCSLEDLVSWGVLVFSFFRSLAGCIFRLLINALSIKKALLIHDEIRQVQPLNVTVKPMQMLLAQEPDTMPNLESYLWSISRSSFYL